MAITYHLENIVHCAQNILTIEKRLKLGFHCLGSGTVWREIVDTAGPLLGNGLL